ncbi:MAG: hypothetical protein IJ789_07010 [Bacteroidales bacterium]|nr:hypothetical protein [Bacteroidales bacterium]
MQTATIESQQNDLIRHILAIRNPEILKKLQASVRRAEKKEAAAEQDDTCMSKEEYFAMIKSRMEDYEKGNYKSMLPGESLDQFLDRIAI